MTFMDPYVGLHSNFTDEGMHLDFNRLRTIRLSEAVPMRPFFRAKNGGRCRMHHTRGRNLLGKCIFCLFDLTDRMRIPLPI